MELDHTPAGRYVNRQAPWEPVRGGPRFEGIPLASTPPAGAQKLVETELAPYSRAITARSFVGQTFACARRIEAPRAMKPKTFN